MTIKDIIERGPGKYDELCTYVRVQAKASGAVVLVFEGQHGNGFSVQVTPEQLLEMPRMLRYMADDIERQMV